MPTGATQHGGEYAGQNKLDDVLARLGRQPDDSGHADSTPPGGTPSPGPTRPVTEPTTRDGDRPPLVRDHLSDASNQRQEKFIPHAPKSLDEAGLSESDLQALVLRYLLHHGAASGAELTRQFGVPFALLEKLLYTLKTERVLAHKSSAAMADYIYELTELGVEQAHRYSETCTYFGTAPVPLDDYVASVNAQSLTRLMPKLEHLREAFADLVLAEDVLNQLGRAMNSGQGLFLYGAPGNGKTCISERVTKAYGDTIWIPRAISAWGEIIRLYDPSNHEILPRSADVTSVEGEKIDQRWVHIRRPTIVVGGELTLDHLEITQHHSAGIGEAPLQLKSNCGTLVIDDFGRQRVSPVELLNRWILPLEKRSDFLCLNSGRTIQVPFDQLIVFSTNLEPKDLVDEAFLRRIPYKIKITDPSGDAFRALFRLTAENMQIKCDERQLNYLIETHYHSLDRPMRFCQPRDLLRQVANYCRLLGLPLEVTNEAIDAAAQDYFAVL